MWLPHGNNSWTYLVETPYGSFPVFLGHVENGHVHPFEDARERIHDVAVQMKKRKMEEKQELQEEKQKTKRLIRLLEAQHEEGIMGDESYEELRSSAEEKLRRVNRKLEED